MKLNRSPASDELMIMGELPGGWQCNFTSNLPLNPALDSDALLVITGGREQAPTPSSDDEEDDSEGDSSKGDPAEDEVDSDSAKQATVTKSSKPPAKFHFLLDDDKIFFGVVATPAAGEIQFTEAGLRLPAAGIWGDAADADVVPYLLRGTNLSFRSLNFPLIGSMNDIFLPGAGTRRWKASGTASTRSTPLSAASSAKTALMTRFLYSFALF